VRVQQYNATIADAVKALATKHMKTPSMLTSKTLRFFLLLPINRFAAL
jgi:hypothetical protein